MSQILLSNSLAVSCRILRGSDQPSRTVEAFSTSVRGENRTQEKEQSPISLMIQSALTQLRTGHIALREYIAIVGHESLLTAPLWTLIPPNTFLALWFVCFALPTYSTLLLLNLLVLCRLQLIFGTSQVGAVHPSSITPLP